MRRNYGTGTEVEAGCTARRQAPAGLHTYLSPGFDLDPSRPWLWRAAASLVREEERQDSGAS